MGIDPPVEDELFDGEADTDSVAVQPEDLDRQWVVGEAAAVFDLSQSDAEQWVDEDGVLAVYARIQAYWGAL